MEKHIKAVLFQNQRETITELVMMVRQWAGSLVE
ncbi:MAG: hypothetical protein HQL53_07465 [Magnetococcales bacterium]|nr:hypothetical protein [Magnetococcales bacterium]